MTTKRDWDAIRARCTRFVEAWAAPRRPGDVLAQLAELAGEERGDVYGGGGAVARLEERVATLLGKERALFFPSGTMAQQIALRILCDRGGSRTVAFHPQCHLEAHEEKAYEHLHGLHAQLVGDRDRLLTREHLDELPGAIGALLLELPQRDLGGQLPEWEELLAEVEWARERGTALHLDGARLWQCGPFYGRPLAEIADLFDTVYVSVYKDLGGLGGCLLAGAEDVVAEARVWRIRHGGRIASVDAYALSGLRGLDETLPRMAELVAKARELGKALAAVDGVRVVPDPPQAAMLHVYVDGELERMREAVMDIAEEQAIVIAGFVAPTPLPDVQRTEIAVGAPTLDVPAAELADLYTELVRRAATAPPTKRRRSARGSEAGARAKPAARRPPTRRR